MMSKIKITLVNVRTDRPAVYLTTQHKCY